MVAITRQNKKSYRELVVRKLAGANRQALLWTRTGLTCRMHSRELERVHSGSSNLTQPCH